MQYRDRHVRALVGVLGIVAAAGSASAAFSFQGLGYFAEGTGSFRSTAYGISPNGQFVVGHAANGTNRRAFRWSASGGLENLGTISGGLDSRAYGISNDGLTAVGYSIVPGGNSQAAVWTAGGGFQALPTSPIDPFDVSGAYSVSADGSRIFGDQEVDRQREVVMWTNGSPQFGLGPFEGQNRPTYSGAISADGSIATGYASIDGRFYLYRWTEEGGLENLGTSQVSPTALGIRGSALSHDGEVIVGYVGTSSNSQGFRWTRDAGIELLGDLPGGTVVSRANAVSGDGSIIVGRGRVSFSATGSGDRATIWFGDGPIMNLNDYLVANGVDLGGWTLREANAISADGRTITGVGINPNNQIEAWVVTIPAPGTLAVAGLLGLAACRRRRGGC